MELYWPYLTAEYYQFLEYMTAFVAVIILISCIDDLFIDAVFYVRAIRRRLTVERKYKPLTADQLYGRPEQHMAIMVPAWLESDVIATMIESMVSTIEYRNYNIFVGTYRNDAATINEVERMRRRYRQLIRVEVPHDGPTCKADCLNWVVQAIYAHEGKNGIIFSGAVIHDSEDVLHPLELRFFNYLLPRIDLIQIPVNSLERDWYDLVAGVYMDEFAEWHGKDIVVREALSGMVPSAGVGTCFSRKALLTLSKESENQPFNTQTLTEDYDVGVRLSAHGMRSILARFPVDYKVKRKTWFGFGPEKTITLRMPLCVREFFPNTFVTSYRQKARWSLGICFQGWAYFGWYGRLIDRYFLLRDRKGMVTVFATIFAYFLALQYGFFQLLFGFGVAPEMYPSFLLSASWIGIVLTLDAIALTLRVAQRSYFTARVFGWEHGLLALPRMIIGNFVNFMAMSRAWKQYLTHLTTGKRLVWDKTMHDFPSAEEIRDRRTRLGELLETWQVIDSEKLSAALKDQMARNVPLGRILLEKGWLEEDVLAEAVAFQADLEVMAPSIQQIFAAYDRFQPDFCFRYRVLPITDLEQDRLGLVAAFPLREKDLQFIEGQLGYAPRQFVARDSVVARGLHLLASSKNSDGGRSSPSEGVPQLGKLLVEKGLISNEILQLSLDGYRPDRDGQIGAYLAQRNPDFKDAIDSALEEQRMRLDSWARGVTDNLEE